MTSIDPLWICLYYYYNCKSIWPQKKNHASPNYLGLANMTFSYLFQFSSSNWSPNYLVTNNNKIYFFPNNSHINNTYVIKLSTYAKNSQSQTTQQNIF